FLDQRVRAQFLVSRAVRDVEDRFGSLRSRRRGEQRLVAESVGHRKNSGLGFDGVRRCVRLWIATTAGVSQDSKMRRTRIGTGRRNPMEWRLEAKCFVNRSLERFASHTSTL